MTTAAYFQVPHALFESWSEASKTFESAAEEPDPATAATAFGKAAQLCEMALEMACTSFGSACSSALDGTAACTSR